LKKKYNIDEENPPRCHPGTATDDEIFFIQDSPLMRRDFCWNSLDVNELWKLFK
jgi:hypothetical protein